jgi:hypothetical protein
MGIWAELFGKHGNRKEKEIQELLAIIKRQEENETRLLKQNEHLEWERDRLESNLLKCLKDKNSEHVKLVINSSTNKNSKNMAIQLDQGSFSLDSLGLVDTDLGTPVSATFANVSFASSDETVFTTAPDPNNPSGTIDTAVAPGTANLTATADATYTDSKTGKSVTQTGLTVTVPVIVNAVVAGENVALTIIQGTPTVSAKKA